MMGTPLRNRRTSLPWWMALLLALLPRAASADSSQALELQMPITVQVAEGEAPSFQITMKAGELAVVTARQEGVDIRLSVLGPDAAELAATDAAHGLGGEETIQWIAATTGEHSLQIEAIDSKATGAARLVLQEVRAPTAREIQQVDARAAYRKAVELSRTRGGQDEAIELLRRSDRIWAEVGDQEGQAETLTLLAQIQSRTGRPEEALESYALARSLWGLLEDDQGQTVVLNGEGTTHLRMGNLEQAKGSFLAFLEVARRLGDVRAEGYALRNLASVLDSLGETEEARSAYAQAFDRANEVEDRRLLAQVQLARGVFLWHTGEARDAFRELNAALRICEELNDRAGLANALVNLARITDGLGDQEKALSDLTRALEIWAEMGFARGQTETLILRGEIYRRLERFDDANADLKRAMEISVESSNRWGEASAHMELGVVQRSQGDFLRSIESLELALERWNQAGEVRRRSNTRYELGRTLLEAGQPAAARTQLETALASARELGHRQLETRCLASLARLAWRQGQLETARSQAEQVVAGVESLRGQIDNRRLKLTLAADRQDHYALLIDILLALHEKVPAAGHHVRALEVHERSRARELLDRLAGVDIPRQSSDGQTLAAKRRAIEAQIHHKEWIRSRASEQRVQSLEQEIQELLRELDEVESEIWTSNPRLAATTQASSLTAEEIQALLKPESLLLVARVGSVRSLLWSVTTQRIAVHELPSASVLGERVDEYRSLVEQSNRRLARIPAQRAAERLGALVLGPVSDRLRGSRRVLWAADAPLSLVPLGGLFVHGEESVGEPLVVRHEIVNLPSASVLGHFQRWQRTVARAEQLAVVADPVYRRDDPRLTGTNQPAAPSEPGQGAATRSLVLRAAADVGLTDLDRLSYSGAEATEISRWVDPTRRTVASGFDASRDAILGDSLRPYSILHLAAHAFVNDKQPQLSGLVLSLLDRQGRDVDGFLRLFEIYGLDLQHELVVLSACRTALGPEIRGEGLVGLSRGFLYGGADSVIGSLWQVDDRATAEFMGHFYRELLGNGQSVPAAQRRAQLAMWRNPESSAPYYWAAFVYFGPQSLQLSVSSPTN